MLLLWKYIYALQVDTCRAPSATRLSLLPLYGDYPRLCLPSQVWRVLVLSIYARPCFCLSPLSRAPSARFTAKPGALKLAACLAQVIQRMQ